MNDQSSICRTVLAMASVAALVALSACASEDVAGDDDGASGSSVAEAAEVYQEYVGGEAGQAGDGDPIRIGYVNLEGGDISFPEVTESADAAVEFVNESLGGVQGRPIELVKCTIVNSEEQGQSCAQEMLNDDDIDLVIEGVAPVGTGAFHQTMAGRKPVIIANPSTVDDTVAANSFAISAGAFATGSYTAYVTDTLEAETVGLLSKNDDPASIAQGQRIKRQLEDAGVEVRQSTYSGTTSDFSAPLTATGGNDNDAIIVVAVTPPACIGAAKAVQQLAITKPVVAGFGCVSQAVKSGLSDFAPWTYIHTYETTALPDASPAVAGYLAVMDKYGKEQVNGLAPVGFAAVMTAVQTLNSAGPDASGEELSGVLAEMTAGPPMFSPDLAFGSIPGEPAMGTKGARAYTYEGNGSWKDATDGKWLSPASGS